MGKAVRILFVDDDPSILSGLRRLFQAERDTWHMVFAGGAAEALPLLAEGQFDIVVSDLRMPGTDGAELLRHARDLNPASIRLILSGQTSRAASLRAASVAHQFLNKPINADGLRQAIKRASDLEGRLSRVRLTSAFADTPLPEPSAALRLLNDELADGHCDAGRVARIIEADPAIASPILSQVNSEYFSMPQQIDQVQDAVVYLGIENVRALAATADVYRSLIAGDDRLRQLAGYLQVHSLQVLDLAEHIHPRTESSAELYLAAQLHDLGLLALAAVLPTSWIALGGDRHQSWAPADELNEFGATHADLGAYLMALWGLPYCTVEAVACHHDDQEPSAAAMSNGVAIRMAEALLSETARLPGHFSGLDGSAHLEPRISSAT